MSIRQNLEVVENDNITLLLKDVIIAGQEPTGTIEITENGTYNVSPFAHAEVNIPLIKNAITPLHKDVKAYVQYSGTDVYYNTSGLTARTTDIYQVINNHRYLLYPGINYGDRKVSGIFETDPYGSTTQQTGFQRVSNSSNPSNDNTVIFTASDDGYYAIWLSNSDQHPNSYHFDITDLV